MRYDLDPERSVVHVHASSSIHPIETSAPLAGELDLELDADGMVVARKDVSGRVSLPLDTMRSGNALIDREADRRLDVGRHPDVVGELVDVVPADTGAGHTGRGRLTFHGVTRDVEGTLRIEPDGAELHLTGELSLDVTDFGVQPPSLLVVKVHQRIEVTLDAVARPVG